MVCNDAARQMLKLSEKSNLLIKEMAASTSPLFKAKSLHDTVSQTVDDSDVVSLLDVFMNPSHFKDPVNQLVRIVRP